MDSSNKTSSLEVLKALRSALKLLASLAGTLLIAFAVRFWMPRFLGPDEFGVLRFTEDFAATFFILGSLGVDTYIRKNIATDLKHASDFFGSLTLLRIGVSALLVVSMTGTLYVMDKSAAEYQLVYLFALGQVFFVLNASFSALLHAASQVNGLSIVNVISKLAWGIAVIVGLLLGHGLRVVAISFLVTEAFKAVVLYILARKHVQLRLTVNWKPLWTVFVASLPFFLVTIATTIYAKIDVSMLSGMTTDAEVGWYGAAVNLTFIIFLLQPVLNAVVLPMGARIAQESTEEMNRTMMSAIRLVLIFSVPIGLLIALNATEVVGVLYGDDYAPSATITKLLAALVPVTYVCTMLSMHLIQLDRTWALVKISLAGLAINPLLNYLLIGPAHRKIGDGGAGLAAAFASVTTECLVAVLLFWSLGKIARDKKLFWLLLRLSAVAGLVTGFHFLSEPIGFWRLLLEPVVYVLVAWPLGAMPLYDIVSRARQVVKNRVG